jgi:adenosylcobyric acid synthase
VGLGLLGLTTEFAVEKVTKLFYGELKDTRAEVVGYEIHHGVTTLVAGSRATPIFDVDGPDVGWKQDGIVGVYAHALLEDTNFRTWWLSTLREHRIAKASSSAATDWAKQLDVEFDRVAQHLEETGFVDFVLAAE